MYLNVCRVFLKMHFFYQVPTHQDNAYYMHYIYYMHIQCILSYGNSFAMYKFLKTLYPGRIRTQDLHVCRVSRTSLAFVGTKEPSGYLSAKSKTVAQLSSHPPQEQKTRVRIPPECKVVGKT
jgi:hypothetical protein